MYHDLIPYTMQSTVHINVSAIDYDATSRALATVLDRMQDMIQSAKKSFALRIQKLHLDGISLWLP